MKMAAPSAVHPVQSPNEGEQKFNYAGKGAAPYKLRVHYYRRGPMGYGMGTVQVVGHDGKGGITVEPRPFVVMVSGPVRSTSDSSSQSV